MSDPLPNLDPEPARPVYDDQRADYDDAFEERWTPARRVRRLLFGPGVAFLVIGPFCILGVVIGLIALVVENLDRALAGRRGAQFELFIGVPFIFLGIVLFSLVIAGGVSLLRMRRRWLCLVAGYVVTGLSLAGPYGILFYPFGIWALVVLYRPDVREQFRRLPPPRDDGHGGL